MSSCYRPSAFAGGKRLVCEHVHELASRDVSAGLVLVPHPDFLRHADTSQVEQ